MPKLAVYTGNDYYELAVLDLTPELASRLLVYRDVFLEAQGKAGERLYRLEFFNYDCEWGEAYDWDAEDDNGEWVSLAEGDVEFQPHRTGSDAVSITGSGAYWTATPRHSQGNFETPYISWEELEAVARGENPFPAFEREEEGEEEGFILQEGEDATLYACANCGRDYLARDLAPLKDAYERVPTGEVMPAGECPVCGAACYAEEEEEEEEKNVQ